MSCAKLDEVQMKYLRLGETPPECLHLTFLLLKLCQIFLLRVSLHSGWLSPSAILKNSVFSF